VAEQLGSAVLTLSVNQDQLKAGLQAAERQAKSTGESIEQAFTKTGKPLQTAANGLQFFVDAQGRARDSAGKFLTLAQQQEAGLTGIGAAADRAGRGVGVLGNIAKGIAGLGASAAAIGFLKSSIDSAVELETITKKLSNTLGPQGAAGALAFTRGLSDQLGLSFKTLSGAFASFTAAATGANVPLQVQKDLFAAVSKAAQQLGLSNDEINGSLLALQQIASKGTVSMEELRGQLGERLPIAFAAAAKGLGVTQRELIKLVEGGGLAAREFFPAITKGLNDLTSASAGAPTAAQNFQQLQNALDGLQSSIGQNILPTLTEQVKNLAGILEGIGVVIEANKLGLGGGFIGNALGIIPDEGARAVGALRSLQAQFNLTDQQARALFTDAIAEAGGRYNPFGQLIIGGKEFDKALASLFDRATRFRERNKDITGELKAQEAEAARLLEIAKARADAEEKILAPSRQALEDARAIQGLQGLALAQAREQLKLDQLRRTERKAIADYDKKLAGSGFNRESPAVIEAAAKVEAAGNAVQAALVAGSDVLKEAAKDAAKRFTDATKQLSEAQSRLSTVQASPEGLNRFLRPDEQFQRVRAAILRLGPDLEQAISSGQKLLNRQGVGLGRPLFEGVRGIFENARTGLFASTDSLKAIQQFIQDVNAEREAISGVNQAQQSLAQINGELVNVNTELRDQVLELVKKDWNVVVNVSSPLVPLPVS
jgi:tape measure domain-containing protein